MPYRIDQFRIDTKEMVGARLRVDGYLSRTGVQVYDDGYGGKRREQRDAKEVFSQDSLDSMRAMPISIGHPANTMLDSTNWREIAVGHIDAVERAEDGIHTKASLWIMEDDAQRKVLARNLSELSVGYYADLDETPGVNDLGDRYDARQINIRGNHVALLKDGMARGGSGCRIRLDSNGNAEYESIDPKRSGGNRMKLKIKADGYDHEVESETDSLVVALEKERTEAQKIVDEMKKSIDELQAKLDAQTEKAKDLEKKLEETPKLDAAAIDAAIQLRADAAKVAGKDVDAPLEDLKAEALKIRGIDLEGKSAEYIDARFDACLEQAKDTSTDLGRARVAAVGNPEENHTDSGDDFAIDLGSIRRDAVRLASEGE